MGCLLVFDVSQKSSFNEIGGWLKEVRDEAGPAIIIILIGNKSDLEHERKVAYEEGVKFAEDNELLMYMECSAKENINVKKAFETLINCNNPIMLYINYF